MEWITVISLILVGIILIVVEIIFVPGTTIVGIIGFGMTITGILMSFRYFGQSVGWITLGITGALTGIFIVWSLRSKPWERFSLKNTIGSKVNEGHLQRVKEGEEGVTVSSLRPGGKAEIGGNLYEVTSLGNFVDSGTNVKVIRITSNQIFVEPLN